MNEAQERELKEAKRNEEELYRIAEYNGKWYVFHAGNWVNAVRLDRDGESLSLDEVVGGRVTQGVKNELPYRMNKRDRNTK